MINNLTTVITLVTVLHVVALGVMIWIRVRRSEADVVTAPSAKTATPCAVCGEPSTTLGYDGLDPNEQRDTRTGRAWSTDMAHYRPVCEAHAAKAAPAPAKNTPSSGIVHNPAMPS